MSDVETDYSIRTNSVNAILDEIKTQLQRVYFVL